MEKSLLLLQRYLTRKAHFPCKALLVLLFLCAGNVSRAQVYYLTSDASASSLNTDDALNRMNYDGTSNTRIVSSFSNSPVRIEQDLANSRLFIYEGLAAQKSIKIVNSGTGAITASISVPYNVSCMRYDAATDYIYFTTTSGSIALDVSDALYKVKPTETTPTLIASSITTSPLYLALDVANSRVFIYESVPANRGIKTFDLTSKTITASATINAGTVVDIAYDSPTGYIYYLTNDGSATTLGATDALNKILPGASTTIVIKAQVTGSPGQCMLLDAGNNRAYIYEALIANRAIKAVNLTTGDVTTVLSLTSYPTAITVSAMASPQVATLTTTAASNTTATSSNLGGNITRSDAAVTSRGVVYSTSNQIPTVGGSGVTQAASSTSGSGIFSIPVTSLSPATLYYVRAYATSSAGTSYGTVSNFTTPSNNANLSAFSISAGTLTPAFNAATTSYTATVPSTSSSITVTPNKSDVAASIMVNNVAVNSGVASGAIALSIGSNVITTVVTAQDGNTKKTYTLTVTRDKAAQTITFAPTATKTYGQADFAPGATASSGLAVSYASNNTAVATIVSGQIHIIGAGTSNITASQAGDANTLAATSVVQTLTVSKATITVTAAVKTKIYGANDPVFTYTATGVVGAEAPTGELTREATTETKFVGTYAINQGTLSYGNNYNVTYVGANLTITKRPITVLPVGKTKVYGDVDPFLNQFQITVGSLAPGDATGDQFGRAAGESAGTYLMTLGTKKFYGNTSSGLADITSNYDITVQPAYVTITAKPVTVTADAKNKTYGDADPALTYTSTELAFSDSFTGALTRAAGEAAGTYTISRGTLALNSNYSLNYTGANLTIDKKIINVTADAKNKTYGDSDPALTYAADATLPNGESFTGNISRAAGQTAGTYAISQNTLALSSNYTLNFTGANFTIDKKVISIAAVANNKSFGDTEPALTYTGEALVAGDTYSGNVVRAVGENAGTYAIGQGTVSVTNPGNYTLNYTPADFTIGKRTIGIVTLSQDVQYGNPDGIIGYFYTGTLAAGDAFTGTPGRIPGTSVGTYATTIGTLAVNNGGNYNLTFQSAPYNIIQREVVVSGGSKIKIYGDADPVLTYSIVSGSLINGAQITGALTRNAGETAGPYAMQIGTLSISDTNHKLTFQGGYFEIDRAPLTIHIDNKTKIATKANPALTYSVTGFKNGDTEATAITPAIQIGTDVTTTTPAGEYAIYLANSISAPNYNINSPNGTFTVTPASTVNTLASATVPNGTFDVPFDPATDFYQVTVPNGTTATSLTVIVTDPSASISIGYDPATGTPIASGTPYSITLSPGYGEQIPVNVTAQNGSVKSYYFNINPIPSDSKLSNLVTSIGTISPTFNANVNSYSVVVSAETASITITPTTHDPLATARVSGGEGGANGPKTISLHEGLNFANITVKSADRTSTTTYQLTIKRPIRLTGLTLSAGTLYPAFNPNTDTYVAKVNAGIASVTVSPTAAESYYQLYVNGENVYTGTSQPIAINDGPPTVITTKVVAGDGETSKTYTINIERSSADAGLASLAINHGTLSPVFSSAVTTYSATVANNVTSITLTPAVVQVNAKIKVNGVAVATGAASGELALAIGNNTITTVVTAEDGATIKTYTLSVLRAQSLSSNAYLSTLQVIGGTGIVTTTGTANENFLSNVSIGTTAVNIKPTARQAGATITVNGVAVASGSTSGLINLTGNTTLITVLVTAENGTTTHSYSVTVQKALSSDAYLSTLQVIGGTGIVTTTGTANENFLSNVSIGTTAVNIKPTARQAGATITVNGVAVASGSTSGLINLTGNTTLITVLVTAENGTTTHSYSVTVQKALSSNAFLSNLPVSPGTYTGQVSGSADENYSFEVTSGTGNVTVKPTAQEAHAVIRVNGVVVASGTDSQPVAITGNTTNIVVLVTAEDGVATRSYGLIIHRGLPPAIMSIADKNKVQKLNPNTELQQSAITELVVHQGLSPNGDGVNDYLTIEGIGQYPNNKLSVMNAGGALVYETLGYGINGNVFDGHANKGGSQMQKAGTYYYSLEYKTEEGSTKRKTGFLVIKQ